MGGQWCPCEGVCGGPYRGAGEAQCFPCGRHWGGSVMSPHSSTCVGISSVPQSSPAAQPCPLCLCLGRVGTVRSGGAGAWRCLPEQRCAQPRRLQRWTGQGFTPWQRWGPAMSVSGVASMASLGIYGVSCSCAEGSSRGSVVLLTALLGSSSIVRGFAGRGGSAVCHIGKSCTETAVLPPFIC